MTSEELANESIVARSREDGGPWFVELVGVVDPPVRLGPYENPDLARGDADKVREFVVAFVQKVHESSVPSVG